ncbi:MAG: trehalose-6-phosphate synthase [Steroidobacteraceae bacterium]
MNRVVAVSNRVSVPRRGTAPGGLAVGVLAAMQARGGLWFGWSGQVGARESDEPEVVTRNGISYATIDLEHTEFTRFLNGFSNGALWPTFHYFVETVHFTDEDYAGYLQVNRRFAAALRPLLRDDDLLWVHDFHLIPLARALREQGAQQPAAFFLHVPFPHVEALRVLPVYGELVNAMLVYDVLGFQTQTDVDSFRSAVLQLHGPEALLPDGSVRAGERRVLLDAYPISVDIDTVQREAIESQNTADVRRMLSGLLGRRLMIGVDRLDYSKGLVSRFRAYERFLEMHPDNLNHITYLQIAPLSRSDLRAYSRIRRDLEQTAGRINGRFAETDWTPIRYLNRNFSHDVLMGFFRAAQVGLVTPVRDGMNLVAKEFVAAQDSEDPGVLILSSLAGAARELTGALLVNPHDTRGVALAIQLALSMPLAERLERHAVNLAALRRNDLTAWHTRMISALAATRSAPNIVLGSDGSGSRPAGQPKPRPLEPVAAEWPAPLGNAAASVRSVMSRPGLPQPRRA